MIDFSKAPECATHYIKGCDVTSCGSHVLLSDDAVFWIAGDYFTWGFCSTWFSLNDLVVSFNPKPIPDLTINGQSLEDYSENTFTSFNPLTVTCDNERQKMLCEQVIRMDSGEASQFLRNGKWINKEVTCTSILTESEYRATPKKELVVPWEWLDLDVKAITVNDRGVVLAIDGSNQGFEIKLALDIEGINLPVTVHRP